MDVCEKIDDLIIQATKERSHYYVKSVLEECKAEIEMLKEALDGQHARGFRDGFIKSQERIKELKEENEHLRAFTEDKISEYINKETDTISEHTSNDPILCPCPRCSPNAKIKEK